MVQLILDPLFNIQQIISNGAGENGCMVKLIVTNSKEIGRSFCNSFASDWVRCCFELHHGIFLLIIIVKTRYNRTIFFTPVIVKYMKKNLDITKTSPIKNRFCQSVEPSLYRGSTVLGCEGNLVKTRPPKQSHSLGLSAASK